MKKILLIVCVMGLGLMTSAQCLLNQDFQEFANGGEIDFAEDPDDAEDGQWLALDLDDLPENAGAGGAGTGNWFGSTDILYTVNAEVVGDTNFVLGSTSFLNNFEYGNRNMLISPTVEIPEGGGVVFRWKSGHQQSPRYEDGYSVWVSPTGSTTEPEIDFSDLMFRKAQMVADEGGPNEEYYGDPYTGCQPPSGQDVTVFDEICWFPAEYGSGTDGITGYRHAENHTNFDYLGIDTTYTASYRGLMEPHAVSLDAYAGTTIRVAILHDSDDDFVMFVDDLCVEVITSVEEFAFEELVTMFPNPASDRISLNFSEIVKDQALVNVYDASGRKVMSETYAGAQLRAYQTLFVSELSTGVYSVQVQIDDKGLIGSTFMKK